MGGDHSSRLTDHRVRVLELIAGQPDLILQETRTTLAAEGIAVGLSTVWRFTHVHNLTRKKKPSTRPSAAPPGQPKPPPASSRPNPRPVPITWYFSTRHGATPHN